MLGMATLLMGPLRRQAALHPRATFCTFAGDRTVATTEAEQLRSIEEEWELLESVTALRTNDSKTQSFTILPHQCDNYYLQSKKMECLGIDFTMQRTTLTTRERGKLEEALARMKRIACLPLSMRLRTTAVSTIALPVSSWALVVTPPTKGAIQDHLRQAWL